MALSPVFYDISDWEDDDDNDAAGIDRIPKLICEDDGGNDHITGDERFSDNNARWRVAESRRIEEGGDLAESEVVFEKGAPIELGEHGSHAYMYEAGEAVNNSAESDFVFQSGVGLGGGKGDLDYMATIEDSDDFDYYDCNMHWAEDNLESTGFIRLVLEHGDANDSHEWWIGENFTDAYNLGEHPGNNDGTDEGEIVFEGRMYENGDVTDGEGNVLGTWK